MSFQEKGSIVRSASSPLRSISRASDREVSPLRSTSRSSDGKDDRASQGSSNKSVRSLTSLRSLKSVAVGISTGLALEKDIKAQQCVS